MTPAHTDARPNPPPPPPVGRSTPAAVLAQGRGARPAVLPAESVDALVTRRTRVNPSASAFEDDSTLVTYEALESAAGRIAAALATRGLTRCSRVAVCMARGSDLLATLLGVLKVGAAYVPIDVSSPPARVRLLLDDAQPHLLVTDSLTHDRLAREFAELVVVKDELLQDRVASPLFPASTPEDVAYIMYTSGSTGRPKGVCITHRAILSRVIHTDYVSITADDRIAFASNVSFDAATFEIWGALVNGAALVPIAATDLVVPARLRTRIRERRVTMLFVTPAVFNTVASEMPTAFAPLRVLMFGGEAANPSAVRRVLAAGPPQTLMNVYGPTECTTFATTYRVRELSDCAQTIPIGRPIAYTDAYVMDSSGEPAPYGSPGELYLGGEGLAEGYHGNPALTAERFVIGPGELGRLYRTGDRCRWRTDGNLEFIGRLDRQIKLRGHRIEPAEIEAALLAHACVANAVVDTLGEAAEDKRLVAYIARMAGCALDPAALRRELQRRLPSYMIPAEFVIAERLPLTPNGKIDRSLLQGAIVAPQERRIAAPRDPLEEDLVRIWQEVLAENAVSIHDDFFDLGGHSLAAAAMVAQVSAAFDRDVQLSLLLENPTLAGFADALVGATRTSAECVVAVRKDGSRPPLFFLHGDINGGGLYCARLARGMEDQPFYALAPFGSDGGEAPASIEAMAARHASAIREVRPRGPYLLGGHCNGALEALEIARLFRLDGHEVPAVVLIQPTPIDGMQVLVQRVFSFASPLLRHDDEQRVDAALRLAERIRQVTAHPVASLKKGPKVIRTWLAGSEGPASGRRTPEGASTPVRHNEAVWDLYERAVAAYVPRRYDGPAAIFLAEEVVDTPADPSESWRKVGKRFEFHIVRGGHLSCITTHVASTASAIDRCLKASLRA